VGICSASLVLAVMIIPYAASLGTTLIRMVPSPLKEGAYALGATRFEVIRSVILPYTRTGLFAGVLLSLGRALGETMAVTVLIGNTSALGDGLLNTFFGPGNTMASVIANEFAEADHAVYLSALIELGLVLFLVTVVINLIGKRIITRFTGN
jgi:phosphate transport system permease protein